MKKKYFPMLVVALLLVVSLMGFYVYSRDSTGTKRECPDAWIDNRMPMVGDYDRERQYFIFDGERQELSDYDVAWIRRNCSVQIQPVY